MIDGSCSASFMDAYLKLELLVSQNQFELLPMEAGQAVQDMRVVYLMNDAVESFLVFKDARMTGTYIPEFEGELKFYMDREEAKDQYVLVLYQGESVISIFFKDLELEVHLFNYSRTGHFWVEGYEYLRNIEYRIAILNNKLEYLGAEYCTEEELQVAALAEFPPLNFCCYPAVPEKYLVPNLPYWSVSLEGLEAMEALCREVNDQGLLRMLKIYKRWPSKWVAKQIAWMLHRTSHASVVDLISDKIRRGTKDYPDRVFSEEEEWEHAKLLEKASLKISQLATEGVQAEIVCQEPFQYAKDSIQYQCYVMVWKQNQGNRVVEILRILLDNKVVQ